MLTVACHFCRLSCVLWAQKKQLNIYFLCRLVKLWISVILLTGRQADLRVTAGRPEYMSLPTLNASLRWNMPLRFCCILFLHKSHISSTHLANKIIVRKIHLNRNCVHMLLLHALLNYRVKHESMNVCTAAVLKAGVCCRNVYHSRPSSQSLLTTSATPELLSLSSQSSGNKCIEQARDTGYCSTLASFVLFCTCVPNVRWIMVWQAHFCQKLTKFFVYLPGQTGRQRQSVFNLSVHLSVCYQTGEQDTLKMSETIWCQLAQVVHRARVWNDQLWGSGGQSSRSQVAKHRFWRVILDPIGLSIYFSLIHISGLLCQGWEACIYTYPLCLCTRELWSCSCRLCCQKLTLTFVWQFLQALHGNKFLFHCSWGCHLVCKFWSTVVERHHSIHWLAAVLSASCISLWTRF